MIAHLHLCAYMHACIMHVWCVCICHCVHWMWWRQETFVKYSKLNSWRITRFVPKYKMNVNLIWKEISTIAIGELLKMHYNHNTFTGISVADINNNILLGSSITICSTIILVTKENHLTISCFPSSFNSTDSIVCWMYTPSSRSSRNLSSNNNKIHNI